jgi:hypothetical protein
MRPGIHPAFLPAHEANLTYCRSLKLPPSAFWTKMHLETSKRFRIDFEND